MSKYLLLQYAASNASDIMAHTTPEQIKASAEEWNAWKDNISKSAKVDFGLPVQAIGKITPTEIVANKSNVVGYSIIEAENKSALLELLRSHPHLKLEGAYIEVFEMLAVPGM